MFHLKLSGEQTEKSYDTSLKLEVKNGNRQCGCSLADLVIRPTIL